MFTGRWLFSRSPLGMNLRNRVIRELNSEAALRLARDKASFKRLLESNGVPTPRTYHEIHRAAELGLIRFPEEFVIKPGKGSEGRGIIILQRKDGFFTNPSAERYTLSDLRRHIRRILEGDFSGNNEGDVALIEERIYPSDRLKFKDAVGLPDIRIFCYRFQPVMAMLRYATRRSRGRSNLAAGALGVGIDLETGAPTFVHEKKTKKELSPQELGIPPAFVMPKWAEMKALAGRASELSGLKLAGVDIVLDSRDRVLVLEINGHPGLEIQNVTESSLLERITASDGPGS